jgi:hypothetical protein
MHAAVASRCPDNAGMEGYYVFFVSDSDGMRIEMLSLLR